MTITKGKVTEIIIKVDDSFLEQAKIKGMKSEYELIRCKDCKHYYEKEWLVGGGSYKTCWNNCIAVANENDYCSRAERKTDDA